jgi:hypothetical protein
MASDPRVFAFSLERRIPHQEIPLSWLDARFERMPDPDRAIEVAPGIRIALMGTGDILLPDGDVCRGARIAVWAEGADRAASLRTSGQANATRSVAAAQRDVIRARTALATLGPRCGERARSVAEARIADPDASWREIGDRLGLTKDQAIGLFRRLMARTDVRRALGEGAGDVPAH